MVSGLRPSKDNDSYFAIDSVEATLFGASPSVPVYYNCPNNSKTNHENVSDF